MKVGLFYGSETGNSREVAYEIQEKTSGTILELTDEPWDFSDVDDQFDLDQLLRYDLVVIGSPTWNIGDLQIDIAEIFQKLDKLDFTGIKIAVYGCGDQDGYPNSYQDAIGIIVKKLRKLGGIIIGKTEITGEFVESQAVEARKFLGLTIDNNNEPELTSKRIDSWIKQLIKEI